VSRYLILVLLNTPLVIAGVLDAVVSYKLNRSSHRRFIFRILVWTIIFCGLIFMEPIYNFLFSNQLTKTEPLSLFDVIQITGIIFTFFIANQAYARVDVLERRIQDLHQELSIQLSVDKEKRNASKKS
jgi:hypothetical protein